MRKQTSGLLLNVCLSLSSIILVLLLVEFGYRLFLIHLLWLAAPPDEQMEVCTQYDRILGWRHIPGKVSKKVAIDRRGFRCADQGRIKTPLKKNRIAAFGDSFTFGDGVRGDETWPAKLENKLSPAEYSVVNMGVCAYGVDQMYLLYREEKEKLNPLIVLAAVISWDLQRTVRTQWKDGGREKPRFIYHDGKLELFNVPVPLRPKAEKARLKWGQILFDFQTAYLKDRFLSAAKSFDIPSRPPEEYQAENIEVNKYAEGVLLSQKIIERWRREVEGQGRRFILILVPLRERMEYYHSYFVRFAENLQREGVEIVDCRPAFWARKKEGLKLFRGAHPSPEGQEVIAAEVYYYLAASRAI